MTPLAAVATLAVLALASGPGAPVRVVVDAKPALRAAPRLGVNLGERSAWGAEQLLANVLLNPGFEGVVDRALVVVAPRAPRLGFADDAPAVARPDGFWSGARYEILVGADAGATGTILDSRQRGAAGLAEFFPRRGDPLPVAGDVVTLTRVADRAPLAKWHVPDDARGRVTTATGEIAPGSPGARSLELRPSSSAPARVHAFLDAIGARAGSLLPVRGNWRFAIWTRAAAPGATLAVTLRRHGAGAPILARTVAVGTAWKRDEWDFDATDPGGTGILELTIEARGSAPAVFVDDVVLAAREDDGRAFRASVVETLRMLRPGYLRDWQGQLGDTLANRVAPPFARRATRYGPGGSEATHATYALDELVALAREADARPWIVVPPTLERDELRALGAWLKTHARGFDEIVLEIGNENWNALFRGAGVPDARTYGRLVARAQEAIESGAAGAVPLRFAAGVPPREGADWAALAGSAPRASLLAVAPYYARSLAAGLAPEARLARLFAPEAPDLARLGETARSLDRELAVYEVNAHTQGGNASAAERDGVVAGAASGAALARRLIEGLAAGAARQCVYAFAGFDATIGHGPETTRLFGIARDLAGEPRLRPTGLALALANRVLPGDVHAAGASEDLATLAVRAPGGWRALLASRSPRAIDAELVFPAAPSAALPTRALVLDGSDPFLTNEKTRDVAITAHALDAARGGVRVRVPAYGVVALVGAHEEAP